MNIELALNNLKDLNGPFGIEFWLDGGTLIGSSKAE
jgi:hypothetical protein